MALFVFRFFVTLRYDISGRCAVRLLFSFCLRFLHNLRDHHLFTNRQLERLVCGIFVIFLVTGAFADWMNEIEIDYFYVLWFGIRLHVSHVRNLFTRKSNAKILKIFFDFGSYLVIFIPNIKKICISFS